MSHIRLLLVGALFLCAGCPTATKTTPPGRTTTTLSPVRADVAGLKREIRLPIQPMKVVWQSAQIGNSAMGPSDSQLLAVLQYTSKDAARIEALARKRGGARKGEVDLRSWFPAPLRQKAVRLGDGYLVLRGKKLDAGDFAHLSLQNGFVFRVQGTPYIVVSLFTT